MNKKPAVTYPWVYVFVCLGLGVLMARYCSIAHSGLYVLSMLTLSCLFLSRRIGFILLLLLFVSVGAFMTHVKHYHSERDIANIGKYYRKRVVTIRGMIHSDVIYKEGMRGSKSVATFQVKEIESPWGWKEATGNILIQVFKKDSFYYGDYMEVEGRLHRPFSIKGGQNFSYRQYLANKNIHYILSVKKTARLEVKKKHQGSFIFEKIYDLRHVLREKLEHYLTKREAGVMSAMLLGDRSHMPKDIRALFVRTGTAHILAISGLHIGILTGLLFVLIRFLPLPRKYQYVLLIFILSVYVILSGLRASVLRATLMAVIFIGGLIWERKSFGLNSLCLAGCILLIYEPYLLFDVGFQLSFTCVLFILLGASSLCQFTKKYMTYWLANAFSVSLCAWFGSAGWVVYYFGMITPIGLAVNIAAIPLMSLVLVFGIGFLCTVFWWPLLAYYFSLCLKLSLNAMVAVIFLFDQCPGSYFYITNVSYWYIMVYYIMTLLILGLLLRARIIDKQSQLC